MNAQTMTGGFGIGFRRGWSAWQKDLPGLIAWAKANHFACLDVGRDVQAVKAVAGAGLAVGSVDLLIWEGMLSADQAKRDQAVQDNLKFVTQAVAAGARNFFCVMIPEDKARPRAENFASMVESFSRLLPEMEKLGARLVVEGWPGPGVICCGPETYRAFFDEVDSPAAGINYDPSHLIRMGIDPIRFLDEFVDRVFHVHGKDTELFADALYEVGHEQPATFTKPHGFGGSTWRYTIPGHGAMSWTAGLSILHAAGYEGMVSIELEDERFNGSEEGEKRGLLLGQQYLVGC